MTPSAPRWQTGSRRSRCRTIGLQQRLQGGMLLMALGVHSRSSGSTSSIARLHGAARACGTAGPSGRDEVHVDEGAPSTKSFFEAMNALLPGAAAGPVLLGANDAAQITLCCTRRRAVARPRVPRRSAALQPAHLDYRGVVEYRGASARLGGVRVKAQAWGTRLGARQRRAPPRCAARMAARTPPPRRRS